MVGFYDQADRNVLNALIRAEGKAIAKLNMTGLPGY